jgi:hypothetical protein
MQDEPGQSASVVQKAFVTVADSRATARTRTLTLRARLADMVSERICTGELHKKRTVSKPHETRYTEMQGSGRMWTRHKQVGASNVGAAHGDAHLETSAKVWDKPSSPGGKEVWRGGVEKYEKRDFRGTNNQFFGLPYDLHAC